MKKNVKGFSAVEVLIILVLLAVVGTAGYLVALRKNDEPAKETTPTINQTEQTTTQVKETDKKYLEIKELGIKIELSSAIQDAYYAVSSQGYVYLSTHYFDSLAGFEYCKAEPNKELGGLGLYAVVKSKVGELDDFGNVITLESVKNNQKVGDYYYSLMKGNGGACFDTEKFGQSSAEYKKYNEIMQAFYQQSSTITAL